MFVYVFTLDSLMELLSDSHESVFHSDIEKNIEQIFDHSSSSTSCSMIKYMVLGRLGRLSSKKLNST